MHFIECDTQDPEIARTICHDFEVAGAPLTFQYEDPIGRTYQNPVPDKKVMMRKDTGQYLGTVGNNWEPVQPAVLYDMAGELINATDGSINGVVSLFDGAVIGINFKLAEREYIEHDKVDINFLMLTAFNGAYGLSGSAVCHRLSTDSRANTNNKVFSLNHTKFIHNRIQVVKDMLKYYNQEITSFDILMNRLVTRPMSQETAIEWFRSLFPRPNSQRSERILSNSVSTFRRILIRQEIDENIPGVKGTSYGAWSALCDYVNHHRTVRVHNGRDEEEVRFQSILTIRGTGNKLIQKGIQKLTDFHFEESEFMIE